jgi:benzoyl-CoA reductase/2-hydroxyglutaryl-CoA dehydratase subunit BcrC/BadD/HgdB
MLDLFRKAYENPETEVERALAEGRKPIRALGFDAPFGLLIKAGFQPIRLVAPPLAATPRADAIMGAAAMRRRGKRLLETLLDPARPEVPVLITAADDEQPQIYAALRELARLGEAVPRHVHFFDRLHLGRESSRDYTAKRLAQLREWLASLPSPVRVDPNGNEGASTYQSSLLARLASLRAACRISGADALRIIGATAILPVAEHIAALEALLADLTDAPALPGQRIFICGTAHENAELYRAIEAVGALIVGEDQAWGAPFANPEHTAPRVASPAQAGERIAAQAAALDADLVLHLTIGGDEAAPWDVAAIKRALPGTRFAALRCAAEPDEEFARKLAAVLSGEPEAPPAPRPAAPRPAATKSKAAPQSRSRKSLTSVADFNAYQRDWFASVRKQVADGAPFAVVNANAPQEILRAMDIPFVVNQWWASIVAAKQQTRRYLGLLREHDYPADVEAYSAQGLAAVFDDDPENAPWGGLPKPDFLHAVASSDATLKMFEQWARETGADCYVYERSYDPRPDLFQDWWARVPSHWDTALEEERLDLMIAELREVIARLEAKTGRTFSPERFAVVMDLVNEQEDYFRKTRDLIARTVPAPIGVVDSMPATMVPQWHRGTVWARDAARAFYEEVKARVDAGLAAVPNERVRLMFVGRGLWSEMGFYQRWEESHGAVFVWSMYLALAADGYIRETSGGRDPLRALASRFITMGDELRMPTWAGPWNVQQADTHNIDAVVALSDADPFVVRALRAAGYPVLELTADNFNRESEDGAAIDAQITAFIEGPASERAAARREATNVGA